MDYITLQRKTSWSSFKEYSRWDEVVKLIEEQTKLPIIELDPIRDWEACFELVSNAKLHLGVDSVFNHVAAARKVPAVILFGSTDPVGFGHSTAVNLHNPLCGQACSIEDRYSNGHRFMDKCPYGKCIDSIEPTQICDAAVQQLGAVRLLPKPTFSKWIVVTRYGGFGDLVALEPTLYLLKKQNPNSGIVLRTYNTYLDLLSAVPYLSGIILDSMNFVTFPPAATGNYIATQSYPDLWKSGDTVTHYNMQGVQERDTTRHVVSVFLRAAGLNETFITPRIPRPDVPPNGLTLIQLRNHKIYGVPNDPFRNLYRDELPTNIKANVRIIDPDTEVMTAQQWMNLVAGASAVFASDTGILHIAAAYGVPNIYGYYSPQFPPEIRTYANITSFTDKELFKAKIKEICT